ncbi:unnamed protein product, partial [Effrenium voratum]
ARLLEFPCWLWYGAALVLWVLTFIYTGYDKVYLILSAMAFILGPGLGEGRGEYSAYSVFNRGQRHLLGELRAEQLDAEQRGDQQLAGYADREPDGGGLIELPGTEEEDKPTIRSRDANRPCSCGSGKKAKRCCFDARPPRDSQNLS